MDCIEELHASDITLHEQAYAKIEAEIRAYHTEKIAESADESTKKGNTIQMNLGTLRMTSTIKQKGLAFTWPAAVTKKVVAQLKAEKLSNYIRSKEEVDWNKLKTQCLINEKTGEIRYVDVTNHQDFLLDAKGTLPEPEYTLIFEDISEDVSNEPGAVVEVVDII